MTTLPPSETPSVAGVAPTADTGPAAAPEEVITPFTSTEDRRFALYMHERENYTKGARDAYQRFDQTIVGLSGGSIVLSITFMKDIGHLPQSLPWLFASWAAFLTASLCAFISLLTSGETDRERRTQLDCSVWEGNCDETRAARLGRITTGLNYWALTSCILGVVLIIVFATYNLLQKGDKQWLKQESQAPAANDTSKTAEPASTKAFPSKEKTTRPESSATTTPNTPTKGKNTSAGTKQDDSPKQAPIPATQSQPH